MAQISRLMRCDICLRDTDREEDKIASKNGQFRLIVKVTCEIEFEEKKFSISQVLAELFWGIFVAIHLFDDRSMVAVNHPTSEFQRRRHLSPIE